MAHPPPTRPRRRAMTSATRPPPGRPSVHTTPRDDDDPFMASAPTALLDPPAAGPPGRPHHHPPASQTLPMDTSSNTTGGSAAPTSSAAPSGNATDSDFWGYDRVTQSNGNAIGSSSAFLLSPLGPIMPSPLLANYAHAAGVTNAFTATTTNHGAPSVAAEDQSTGGVMSFACASRGSHLTSTESRVSNFTRGVRVYLRGR